MWGGVINHKVKHAKTINATKGNIHKWFALFIGLVISYIFLLLYINYLLAIYFWQYTFISCVCMYV